MFEISSPPRFFRIPLQVTSLLLGLSQVLACQSDTNRRSERLGVPGQFVPGSFKLSLQQSASDPQKFEELKSSLTALAKDMDCSFAALEPIRWDSGVLSADLAHTYHLQLSACNQSQEQVARTLESIAQQALVDDVEAVASFQLQFAENDPYKGRQYHLSRIRRDEACSLAEAREAKEVVVAVIDSGVETTHPDLVNSFLRDANGQVVGANFVGKGATLSPDKNWNDRNGHGTHVAGLIAATHQNQEGVVGVGSCAKIKIIPVRVMDDQGRGSSIEIERGVQWAAAQGADIINLSLGSNSSFFRARSSHPQPLYEELAQRKVIVFAAAGNDGKTLGPSSVGSYTYTYPASYDKVIAVAATDERDLLANFSNRGETIDIAAPGARDLSTYLGGSYQSLSGTSMASPVAAGAYALALSLSRSTPEERFSYDQIKPILYAAVRSSHLKEWVTSGGVLDSRILAESLIALNRGRPTQDLKPSGPETPSDRPAVDSSEFRFLNLVAGQSINSPFRISLSGWPENKTARIYLYWVSTEDPRPYSFVTLDRSSLDSTGKIVQTADAYYFYGSGTLVAEAVDATDKRLQLLELPLRGR